MHHHRTSFYRHFFAAVAGIVLAIAAGFFYTQCGLVTYDIKTPDPYELPLPALGYPTPHYFRFAIIADQDTYSKVDGNETLWESYLKIGLLKREDTGHYSITWEGTYLLHSSDHRKGRGMELSSLKYINGYFYTICDYTGILYRIAFDHSLPPDDRFLGLTAVRKLEPYDGDTPITLKAEWMERKDGELYIGSIGKEWVVNDTIQHQYPQWVHKISLGNLEEGGIVSTSWKHIYDAIREKLDAPYPKGYVSYESVLFYPRLRKWVFYPRRHSPSHPYDEVLDEIRGTNLFVVTDEDFSHPRVFTAGALDPAIGATGGEWIPGTNEFIVLYASEKGEQMESYISVIGLTGEELVREGKILFDHNVKYEGVAIFEVLDQDQNPIPFPQ